MEIVFPRYNSDDFVLRYEILKKIKERKYSRLFNGYHYLNDCIIDDMKDYGFISIIPSFLYPERIYLQLQNPRYQVKIYLI